MFNIYFTMHIFLTVFTVCIRTYTFLISHKFYFKLRSQLQLLSSISFIEIKWELGFLEFLLKLKYELHILTLALKSISMKGARCVWVFCHCISYIFLFLSEEYLIQLYDIPVCSDRYINFLYNFLFKYHVIRMFSFIFIIHFVK